MANTARNKNKPGKGRLSRALGVFGAFLAIVGVVAATGFMLTRSAFADPHAMFYTNRGQEQVFYNVLAALNQADYVEPPSQEVSQSAQATDPPKINADIAFGDMIAEGRESQQGEEEDVYEYTKQDAETPIEPEERDNLPRLRVRQVTSDNGDVFFREQVIQRAIWEEKVAFLSYINCTDATLIYGPRDAQEKDLCPREDSGNNNNSTP